MIRAYFSRLPYFLLLNLLISRSARKPPILIAEGPPSMQPYHSHPSAQSKARFQGHEHWSPSPPRPPRQVSLRVFACCDTRLTLFTFISANHSHPTYPYLSNTPDPNDAELVVLIIGLSSSYLHRFPPGPLGHGRWSIRRAPRAARMGRIGIERSRKTILGAETRGRHHRRRSGPAEC